MTSSLLETWGCLGEKIEPVSSSFVSCCFHSNCDVIINITRRKTRTTGLDIIASSQQVTYHGVIMGQIQGIC